VRQEICAEFSTETATGECIMKDKKRPAAFRQGRFGACEARLYEFRGRCYPSSSEEEKIERFAADSIYEGLVYLKRREPDFEVMSVQCVGLITLLSGSPLD